jgi:hypothetical protein
VRFTGLVVTNDGKVAKLLDRKDKRPERPDFKTDGKGRTLMPGIIDAHGHVMGRGFPGDDPRSGDTRSLAEVQAKVAAYVQPPIPIAAGSSAGAGIRNPGGSAASRPPPIWTAVSDRPDLAHPRRRPCRLGEQCGADRGGRDRQERRPRAARSRRPRRARPAASSSMRRWPGREVAACAAGARARHRVRQGAANLVVLRHHHDRRHGHHARRLDDLPPRRRQSHAQRCASCLMPAASKP